MQKNKTKNANYRKVFIFFILLQTKNNDFLILEIVQFVVKCYDIRIK